MRYCQRCLYPENHPLGLTFDDEGVCSGCRVHEEKDELDWVEKGEELGRILASYRNRAGSHYDCVIPVSGNGDSFFVVDTIKKRYGLNPLLVTYNVQSNTKVGIRNLARLISALDCDHMQYTVAPATVKAITRVTMHKLGDMYWHVLAGSQTFPVQVATKLKIPLVVWGVHGWLDQVGMFSHYDAVEMTKKVRKEHGLRSFDAEDLAGLSAEITMKDLQAFTYPSDAQLEKSRVRGIYLGNYVRWDAQKQIEAMIAAYGYETSEQERTYNRYETHYCWNNAGVHDYMKFLKWGYGKVSDHASRDIRLQRLSREQAIQLACDYEARVPQKSLELFLNWLGLSEQAFYNCLDQFRDPHAWERHSDGSWVLLDSVCQHQEDGGVEAVRLPLKDPHPYEQTELLEPQESDNAYILMGRSYMDTKDFKAVEG